MIIILDNYDSFTYILYQYIKEQYSKEVKVICIDQISETKIQNNRIKSIIISPGPGRPSEKLINIVKRFNGKMPILGVCLGHQAIGLAYGAKLVNAPRILHGKTSKITHNGKYIFKDTKNPLIVGRYNSLILDKDTLPNCFETISLTTEDKILMAIKFKEALTFGIQFHPESILTINGKTIIFNFLKYI